MQTYTIVMHREHAMCATCNNLLARPAAVVPKLVNSGGHCFSSIFNQVFCKRAAHTEIEFRSYTTQKHTDVEHNCAEHRCTGSVFVPTKRYANINR